MTLFKNIMRIVSAIGGAALVILIPRIHDLFTGPVPSDISPWLWGLISAVGLFVYNFFLSKKQPPASQ